MSHGALIYRLQRRLGLDPESIGVTTLQYGIDEACASLGVADASALLTMVDRSERDWQRLVDLMVVPETWFFRVSEQFDDLLRHVRGELSGRRPLRILSLPCATGEEVYSIAATLALGTPILSLLGAVGAALTLGLRSGAALVFLLVLPLTVPALIFGTGAVVAIDGGLSAQAHFSLLGALLIFTGLGAPPAAAAALRISLD